MTPWTDDPRERARFLDGECSPAERAEREADLARDSAAAERVRRDAEFLAVVRRGAQGGPELPEILEGRVRRAVAADRAAGFPSPGGGEASRRRRRFALATACAALLATGVGWVALGRGPEASAADKRVLLAAKALREAARGHIEGGETGAACGVREAASPHRFPPVSAGDFELASCDTVDGSEASVSVLTKGGAPKDLRGLVAVPWDGKTTSTDVGYTRLGDDVVVFDVSIGGAKYYLATKWSAVAGTTSCAACHGGARASQPERNPHHIFERRR